jgi:hypothetical protein
VSTKIYNAYRVKSSVTDIWAFLRELQQRARFEAHERIQALVLNLGEALPADDVALLNLKDKGWSEASARQHVVWNILEQRRPVSESYPKINCNAQIMVRELDGRFYLQAGWGEGVHGVFSFLETLPELEDYHYQNQTDQPDDISEAEWEERRLVWDTLYDRNWSLGCVLDVVTPWNLFRYRGPKESFR